MKEEKKSELYIQDQRLLTKNRAGPCLQISVDKYVSLISAYIKVGALRFYKYNDFFYLLIFFMLTYRRIT